MSTARVARGERARVFLDRVRAGWREAARAVARLLRPRHWTADDVRAAADAVGRHRLSLLVLGAGAAAVLLAAWALRGEKAPFASAEVREGPFRVSIVEAGTLEALRSVTYASRIQSNQAKIVAMAPEGKMVEKGDLLLLFDRAPFEEEIRKNQALLAQARADLLRAREDLTLQQLENAEDLQAARLRVEKNELELLDVQAGKGLLKEEEALSEVKNAERELHKAEGQLEDLRPLLAEGFITRAELERAEQQVARAREDLDLARRRRGALLEFGRPLELSQARSDAQASRETLRQLESATSSRVSQRRAAIEAASSRIEEAEAKLALARKQLENCEVTADVSGIVVYKDVFFGSEHRKPQVGDQVWANQPLLILPDITKMVVETRVRETDIHKVEKNQDVTVGVDAYPDMKLTGTVTLVGTLAQEEKSRRGAKFFSVRVQIAESEPRLRPGMTARVEIEVEERARALYLPLEAVFQRDGRSVVYLARRRPTPREVVLGPSNREFVVVEKGLAPGDRVLLRDPEAVVAQPAGSSDS